MERDAGLRRIVCSSPNDGYSIVSESSHESIAGTVDFFEYRGSVLVIRRKVKGGPHGYNPHPISLPRRIRLNSVLRSCGFPSMPPR